MERFFGVISPPIALHATSPDMLAAAWMMMYESLLVPGKVDRAAKEAVATAVSAGNACPYCVTVHGTMLRSLDRKQDAAALATDRYEMIDDPALREITLWTRANTRLETAADYAPPFPADHAPEVVGVAAQFQYINRMVNVFLGEQPLPPFAPPQMIRVTVPVLSRLLSAGYRKVPEAGGSLDLLPASPLPPTLPWAAADERIAQAFGRISGGIEAAGRRSVPERVRALVLSELADWDGQPKGLSRAWVTDALRVLPAEEHAAGRLALLTAFASYQVDEAVIKDFRAVDPSDAALVELVAWASMAAATQAAGWMWISGSGPGRAAAVDGAVT
jgi:AhpD family alkylhydroperoxidase